MCHPEAGGACRRACPERSEGISSSGAGEPAAAPSSSPLYDRIGVGYDTTRRADPYLAGRLAELLGVRADGRYLDLACGTGNYTTSLSARGGRWLGVDRSGAMLATARAKRSRVSWLAGDAARLPFRDAAFDGVLCTLALHHMGDHRAVFDEVRRILASGPSGSDDSDHRPFVIFTSDPDLMSRYWLTDYFPTMMGRAMRQMPPIGTVERLLRAAGFAHVEVEPYAVRPDLEDLFLFAGKHRPSMYLDPRVRAGISSFANLSTREEVEAGLARLASDVDTGAMDRVIRDAETERGEYLFVRATTDPKRHPWS